MRVSDARLERDSALDDAAVTQAFHRLRHLSHTWHEVDPSDPIREAAVRFLRVHPLHAADALQLAAAFIAAERRPSSLEIVTLDDRLAAAGPKGRIRVDRGDDDRIANWRRPVGVASRIRSFRRCRRPSPSGRFTTGSRSRRVGGAINDPIDAASSEQPRADRRDIRRWLGRAAPAWRATRVDPTALRNA